MAHAVAGFGEIQDLTIGQISAYEQIRQMLKSDELIPSLGEIAARLDISISSAATIVNRLIVKGYLERTPGKYRSLRLTDKRPPRVRIAS